MWTCNLDRYSKKAQNPEGPGVTFYEARTNAPVLTGEKAYRSYFVQGVKWPNGLRSPASMLL